MELLFNQPEPGIYSSLDHYTGAPYDKKARMYEKLVSSRLYNRIIWGTSPDDYKNFAKKAIGDSDGNLIDVGCGGLVQTADVYAQTKRECILSDNSLEMLKIARSRLTERRGNVQSNIKLLQADAFHLPFGDNSFDTVVSFGMIHLFDNKKEFVNECLRVLKHGGKFYFSSMTTKRRISRFYMKQLRKHGEFGEPASARQHLDLFDKTKYKVDSKMQGSMIFIEGKKI